MNNFDYIIINPNAQSGKGKKVWEKYKKEYSPKGKIIYSKKTGDICKIVELLTNCIEKKKFLIVGGDGSFHEAINGLSNWQKHSFYYYPAGSGNDLSRSLNRKTLQMKNNVPYCMDLGEVLIKNKMKELRYFAVSCGVGFDAEICAEMEHSSIKKYLNKFHLGKFSYLLLGIKHLCTWKPQEIVIKMDDEEWKRFKGFLFLSAHIHPYEGGGFPFCPNADFQDGKLHLCLVHSKYRGILFLLIPAAKFGKHINKKQVEQFVCEEVKINLQYPVSIHADGEVLGKSRHIWIRNSNKKVNIYKL